MRSEAAARVAVVGGGFSGVMTAVQLARLGIASTIYDGGPNPGRGTAYGTTDPRHLLNVPAGKMSAFPHDPDHFRAWAGVEAGTFVPRRNSGRYLEDIRAAHPLVTLETRNVAAIERSGEGWRLHLADGGAVEAAAVVLALGNEAPSRPRGWDALAMETNPWSEAALEAVREAGEEDRAMLLIGTGLTMIDVVMMVEDRPLGEGIVAVSRRGMMPRSHAPYEPAPVDAGDVPHGSLMAAWRWLRKRSAAVGWRAAVDSLRPHTAALWQSWSLEDQRRFLRHARPWWDAHRHRIAPEIAERLRALVAEGRLSIMAGRLVEAGPQGAAIVNRHGGATRAVPAPVTVNCTGPLGDVTRSANPLLRQILADGLAEPDPLRLGLRTDAEDRAAPGLFAVGPLTKGMYWEMVAVPDIRHQAERVAGSIAKELLPHG
jgi:uncharacterized NAD(P)/FAD-binding protein YdhS